MFFNFHTKLMLQFLFSVVPPCFSPRAKQPCLLKKQPTSRPALKIPSLGKTKPNKHNNFVDINLLDCMKKYFHFSIEYFPSVDCI